MVHKHTNSPYSRKEFHISLKDDFSKELQIGDVIIARTIDVKALGYSEFLILHKFGQKIENLTY